MLNKNNLKNENTEKEKDNILPFKLNESVFKKKYKINNETYKEMCERVSYNNEQFDLLYTGKFIPAGRHLTGRGYEQLRTLFNCYALGFKNLNNEGRDSRLGISDLERRSDTVSSKGGGIGVNFSVLRPKRAKIKEEFEGANITSSGVVPFIERFAKTQETITQGGNRRGALIGLLNCNHPDIFNFINVKQDLTKLQNMNISVFIDKKFIDAVENDEDYDLIFPDFKKVGKEFYNEHWTGNIREWIENGYPVLVYETIKARKLWDNIIENAWKTGEPGIIFEDNVNETNNYKKATYINTTNPCVVGETLVMTNIGWIKIENLKKYKEEYPQLKIITQNKDGKLFNSELEWVGITEKNDDIIKTEFDINQYRLTNKQHKFYDEKYNKIKIEDLLKSTELPKIQTNSGKVANIINIGELNYKQDVYDLTAIPNYNFFSVLNKQEYVNTEIVVVNDNINFNIYDVVNLKNNEQKFAIDLRENDELE